MPKRNILQEKSFEFAVQIIELARYLCEKKKEFVISKQILRSGKSVGANIEEAIGSQTRKDFYFRLTISYKEARESSYWLKLVQISKLADESQIQSLLNLCEEIMRIIGSTLKTLRQKNNS